jgi:WD40 repeat protein
MGQGLASAGNDGTVKVWHAASGQELRPLEAHTRAVRSVAFSPDSTRLASAGDDTLVEVWDAASSQVLRSLQGHTMIVTSVVFSPNGKCLASAGYDKTVRLWDAASGQVLHILTGHTGTVQSVVFSPNGAWLASGGDDGTVKLWDATSGQELLTFHVEGPCGGVAFSPDGTRLASSDNNGTVMVWDAASGRVLRSLQGHTNRVRGVAFSPNSAWLASGGEDGTVKVWDVGSGQDLRTLKGHSSGVLSVAFSPDGTRVASASAANEVKVWHADSGQELRTLHGVRLAFSQDGMRLATAGADGTVEVWDARPWTPDMKAQHEALGLVEFLFTKGWVKTQVMENLGRNKSLTEPVRQKALALVEPYWKGVVHQQAVRLVDSLFAEPLLKTDAVDRVRKNQALGEEVRQEALTLAQGWQENPNLLHNASWAVACKPHADASAYELALRQAEQACRLVPDVWIFLNTLGVAQYRASQYQLALDTLLHSDRLHAIQYQSKDSDPSDLAFLAMTYHQLGQKERAGDYMKRLRETMHNPRWATSEETQAFLHEAEASVQAQTENR